MPPLPDVSTLRLCSMLAGLAFALVFCCLWLRQRRDGYLLYWAASSAGYTVALLGFQSCATPAGPVVGGILYALLAATNVLVLGGVRAFDGARPPGWWMTALPLAIGLAYAVPILLAGGGAPDSDAALGRICGMLGLTGVGVMTGARLMLDAGRAGLGRRIAGAAILLYVPANMVAIGMEIAGGRSLNLFAMFAMLSDQILLPILNLGLLAMPGERAERALRDLAYRDALTGLWNRTALQASAARLIRPGNAAILIDVDHFKQINDCHGHGAGDAVLQALAARMAEITARRGGYLARLGGDEFLLILTAPHEEAALVAEQVRVAAARPVDGLPRCTVSLGIATIDRDGLTLSEAMARADRSLYFAKAMGRDRAAA